MLSDPTANRYAGASPKVPAAALSALLKRYAPTQPIALAAYLNGTPTLTALEQLTTGEIAAMTTRLTENPKGTLKGWAGHAAATEKRSWL